MTGMGAIAHARIYRGGDLHLPFGETIIKGGDGELSHPTVINDDGVGAPHGGRGASFVVASATGSLPEGCAGHGEAHRHGGPGARGGVGGEGEGGAVPLADGGATARRDIHHACGGHSVLVIHHDGAHPRDADPVIDGVGPNWRYG